MGCGVTRGEHPAQQERCGEHERQSEAKNTQQRSMSVTQGGFVSVDNDGNEVVNPDAVPLTENAQRREHEHQLNEKIDELGEIDRANAVQEVVVENQSVDMDDFA